jgi:Chs5-Arf1p-binding protein BUD7/BCH1
VRLMHDALQEIPMDYALLDCQATFCQSKGHGEIGLECAKRSVTAAPSEFGTWAKLAEVYVGLEQWDLALLTLNACPMFTYQDKDAPRMPEPSRVLLPILPDAMLDDIDEGQPKQGDPFDIVHPSLRKLHAATYQGTFLKAYTLLTKITAAIGWDQLLKVRSQVFVMEEEYRSERQTIQPTHNSRNASTVALPGSPGPGINGDAAETDNHVAGDNAEPSLSQGQDPNGTTRADAEITEPEHTIASEVVKAGNEDVSWTP